MVIIRRIVTVFLACELNNAKALCLTSNARETTKLGSTTADLQSADRTCLRRDVDLLGKGELVPEPVQQQLANS